MVLVTEFLKRRQKESWRYRLDIMCGGIKYFYTTALIFLSVKDFMTSKLEMWVSIQPSIHT